MYSFEYSCPTEIIFGQGAEDKVAEKIFGITDGAIDERARAGIDAMENYFRELGTPTNFSELGIGVQSDDELNFLANMVTSNGTKKVATFQPMDKDLVLQIYQKANH